MDKTQAKALRAPFPDSVIGKLPRTTCKACRESPRKRCDNHQWVSGCPECHGSHTSGVIHLDYVGHAAATDRLLQVDPEWTWEPFAVDAMGLPAIDAGRNLWIRLTIAGVTRIGVGDGASLKECIGDAIRNAAMRFGVALDLWAKGDLHADSGAAPVPSEPVDETAVARAHLWQVWQGAGRGNRAQLEEAFAAWSEGELVTDAKPERLQAFADRVRADAT